MDALDIKELKQYRQEHPRCRYCVYHKETYPPIAVGAFSIHKCILKDRVIKNFLFSGMLCSWYRMDVKIDEI